LESAERLYWSLQPNYPENRRVKNPEYLQTMRERAKMMQGKRIREKPPGSGAGTAKGSVSVADAAQQIPKRTKGRAAVIEVNRLEQNSSDSRKNDW
jgi:hypothetical protein